MVLLGLLVAVVLGAVVLGGIARGVGVRGELQSAADLSALAGARAMHDAYPRVFEPPVARRRAEPAPPRARATTSLWASTRRAATAARNGAHDVRIAFPGAALAPIRVRVTVHDAIAVGDAEALPNTRHGRGRARAAGRSARRRRAQRRRVPRARSPIARASRCAPTSRWPSTAWRPPPAPTGWRCSSPRPSAPTPSRRGSSPRTPIPSGSRGRERRCTASAPSSTSGRRAPTAGWRPTPSASTSSSATRGSRGISATR